MNNVYKIPVYANLPRQLKIYDDESGYWLSTTDESVIAKTKYIAVSYRQSDFPDREKLEELVQGVCFNYHLRAYWLDCACTGASQEEKNQDLYRIADVFRLAYKTLILIEGMDNKPRSKGWLSWGGRKWTLPEALLSKTFVCKVGKREPVDMGLIEVTNHAYQDDDDERTLIFLYGSDGKDFLSDSERVELLCKAILSRASGPGPSANIIEGEFTAYPAEWVYALMGFFLHRIEPTPTESEKDAFMELLDVNGLECDECSWENFWRSGGKEKIGIRIKGVRTSVRITDADLPKYVAAAKFDYGQTVRTTCEKGTREETLAKIYRWLGLDSDKSRHEDEDDKYILWLHGLAGSGKSTIAQTVAERCYEEEILGATFFFSQDILECKDSLNIIPTLSYELSQKDDVFKSEVSNIFLKNRGLQRAQVHLQLNDLIVKPLQRVKKLSHYVVVIDALDECEDNKSISVILDALDKHISKLAPLKFLITSRPDDHIHRAFRTLSLSGDTKDYNLNNIHEDEANKDIRAFLEPQLRRIGYNMPQPWPSPLTISQLVEKARGLFIFASTALNFLENRNLNDLNGQLRVLLSATVPTSNTPYAHLDHLYLQVLKNAFPTQDELPIDILQTIFSLLILGIKSFSVNKLQDLMSLPQGTIRDTLRHLRSLLAIPDNDDEDIRLIHPSIHDFLTDAKRCIDRRFVLDEAAGHSSITSYCLTRLIKFTSDDMQMRSYMTNPSMAKLLTLTYNLRLGDDTALTYACRYWIFHINKSDGQLDESVLRRLGELVSNHLVLNIFVGNTKEALSVFLDLFDELACWPSPPFDVMKQIYDAVVTLCRNYWPNYMGVIEEQVESIIDARATLQTQLSHKGYSRLYDLDPNFPLLPIAISEFANFLPYNDVRELEIDIRKLRSSANGVHELIMQLDVPEDNSDCLALRECMYTLYEELISGYETYFVASCKAGWGGEEYAKALRSGLSAWVKSLNNFQTKVHNILGNSDNIKSSESSESSNTAIAGAPEQNWMRTSATIFELSNEYNSNVLPVARTSWSDGNEGRHPDELELHESLVVNKTLYNALDATSLDVSSVNKDTDDTEHAPAASSLAKHSRLSPTADSPDWKRLRAD